MLQWKREKPFERGAVKVKRHHALYLARPEQVGNEACADRVPTRGSSVLTRVTKVRNYGSQTRRAGAAACVCKHEEIEQMLVHGRACRLNQIHVAAANTFLNFDVKFAVGKARERPTAERQTHPLCNRRGKREVCGANENYRMHRLAPGWLSNARVQAD